MIALYDLEDNLITIFDTFKECAEYFDTSTNSIRCHLSLVKCGYRSKKRDRKQHKWCRLFRIEDDE